MNTKNTNLKYNFRKFERIHKKKEFDLIFNSGEKVWYNNLLMFIYRRNDNNPVRRLGLVVSSKIEKSAVLRNRFKRRIREIFRLNKHKLSPGIDIVVVAKKHALLQDYHTLEKNFIEGLKKVHRWNYE